MIAPHAKLIPKTDLLSIKLFPQTEPQNLLVGYPFLAARNPQVMQSGGFEFCFDSAYNYPALANPAECTMDQSLTQPAVVSFFCCILGINVAWPSQTCYFLGVNIGPERPSTSYLPVNNLFYANPDEPLCTKRKSKDTLLLIGDF
jgi:hypothetical protein